MANLRYQQNFLRIPPLTQCHTFFRNLLVTEMNEPVFENSMFTADKDLHSECDNLLQMGTLADSTELQYTENRFILNKFPILSVNHTILIMLVQRI